MKDTQKRQKIASTNSRCSKRHIASRFPTTSQSDRAKQKLKLREIEFQNPRPPPILPGEGSWPLLRFHPRCEIRCEVVGGGLRFESVRIRVHRACTSRAFGTCFASIAPPKERQEGTHAPVVGKMAMARARTAWRIARTPHQRWMGTIYDDREKGEEVRALRSFAKQRNRRNKAGERERC